MRRHKKSAGYVVYYYIEGIAKHLMSNNKTTARTLCH